MIPLKSKIFRNFFRRIVMGNRQYKSRFPIGLITGVAVAILGAGGAAAWWTFHKLTHSTDLPDSAVSQGDKPSIPRTPSSVQPSVTEPQSIAKQPSKTTGSLSPEAKNPAQEERIKVYWLKVTDTRSTIVSSTVAIQKSTDKSEEIGRALESLLAGPTENAYTTTIPQGTKLLGIKVKNDGVHLNLSREFTTGGGSDSMMGRLGQILYTATSLEPNSQLWIDVEGKPLEYLGGEGIVVDRPMTRQNFKENFEL
jgi:spore germination protein GerM